jgi:5,5'-dehydrodivanillate O-demethylase
MAWVTQGRIADRTKERLGDVDRGVVLLRRQYFQQMERVRRGEDPMNVLRGPGSDRQIDVRQEVEKFGHGAGYVRDLLIATQARFSQRRAEIARRYAEAGIDLGADLLDPDPALPAPGRDPVGVAVR